LARRLAAAILGSILTVACGGSSSSPTSVPTPAPTRASTPVVLDATSFDTLVLASGRSCLVEFQRPT
jgi:hypothetical protein